MSPHMSFKLSNGLKTKSRPRWFSNASKTMILYNWAFYNNWHKWYASHCCIIIQSFDSSALNTCVFHPSKWVTKVQYLIESWEQRKTWLLGSGYKTVGINELISSKCLLSLSTWNMMLFVRRSHCFNMAININGRQLECLFNLFRAQVHLCEQANNCSAKDSKQTQEAYFILIKSRHSVSLIWN